MQVVAGAAEPVKAGDVSVRLGKGTLPGQCRGLPVTDDHHEVIKAQTGCEPSTGPHTIPLDLQLSR